MSQDRGFSLVELMVVMAVTVTVTAAVVLPFQAAAAAIRADANLRIMEGQLRFAREAAVNQRRPFELRFTEPNLVEVVRHNLPNGTTVVSTARLEDGLQFVLVDAVPDTPDAFGRVSAIDFGGVASVRFTADGMLTDAAGNPVNGTIFLARPGETATARALTIFGVSARVRSYRWTGAEWGR